MFTLRDDGYSLCDGLTRRDWLKIGGIFGLSLPTLLRAREAQAARGENQSKQKACILLWLSGGPPQHETWDPKPDAPEGIRGELKPIATNVVGLQVGELMPRTASLADKVAVLRAVSTRYNDHYSSMYWMLTGQPHNPPNTQLPKAGLPPNDWPGITAVIKHLRRGKGGWPAAVLLPELVIGNDLVVYPGQNGGFLGRKNDPWLLTCDPSSPDFQVPGLSLPAEVPPLRFDRRRSLLDQVNQHLDKMDRSGAVRLYDAQSQQAFDLLRAAKSRQAFDLQQEPAKVRERYGRHKFGQSVLLARRLVEAGVSLVQVNWPREPGDMNTGNPCWDTHQKNTERLKNNLMPPMDQAYSAVLEDLAARGMLDETLVVWAGEFGRTPKLNAQGGRDHWGNVFSVALAGGGIRGGQVWGASDRIGAHPKDGCVLPQDLMATIFHCLGHQPDTELHDALGRTVPISRGEVIRRVV